MLSALERFPESVAEASREQILRLHTADRLAAMVFHEGSQIDLAMVQVVPLFDIFAEDPEEQIDRCHSVAELLPGKVIFCGGTDPILRGLDTALWDIEHQIRDLGAKSMKFYNAHARGRSWRLDDSKVAYPMFERMLELGVNLVQVHKGNPLGPEPLPDLQAHDVAEAALAYPMMNFIIHHLGLPYEDETIAIAARFPNIYLSTSTWINMIRVAPYPTAMRIGKILFWCGSEKLIWGSEAPAWPNPQSLLELCWTFEMPEELISGWGFPTLTQEDRSRIFGGNMLRLLGMQGASSSAQTM
jgi:predicted TIM-barrel fold metal-dependent hydrolase